MPYSDEDEPRFGMIDGVASDYYPSRRPRMIIAAILAGWFVMMLMSSHQAFVDRLLFSTELHVKFMLLRGGAPGDWMSSPEQLRVARRTFV